MKNKQKTPNGGAQFAGTPPLQHSDVVLAQQDEEAAKKVPRRQAEQAQPPMVDEQAKAINADDIEADLHNGSGGAFEATEQESDEE